MPTLLEELTVALQERYRVERELGRGGMATVYLADDLKHGRRVAVKVMSPDVSSSVGGERFQREIQISARLTHPHILPVFDSGEASGLLYYVMPFVEGESLRDKMNRESQLAIDETVQIVCEVADALQYAHDQGIVHRDIKPENVMLSGGHAVVADFGIARLVTDAGTDKKLTATGLSLGTAQYMSPEQFVGANIDGRADLYSLACMAYEMLVGQVPFTGANTMAIIARATMEMPSSIRVVRNTVPAEIEDAIMRGLEKVPADRFHTVSAFKQALLGGGTPGSGVRRTTTYTARYAVPEAPPSRWTAKRIGTIAAVAAIALLGGFASWRFGRTRAANAAGALGGPQNVAVLYFAADSAKQNLRPLADGLTEGLITQLAQAGVSVVSRNGVARFRSADPPMDTVRKALDAGYVVQGAVEPTKTGVKVSVKLVDAQSGERITGTAVERDSAHLVELQGEVVSNVADFLREQLGKELVLRTRAETKSNAAWLLVQRAVRRRATGEELARAGNTPGALGELAGADSMLLSAARLDDRWAAVPEERARVAYRRAVFMRAEPAQAAALIDSGIAYANQALSLDERSADALETRGALQYARYTMRLVPDPTEADQVLTRAQQDLQSATSFNPKQATAWALLSRLYYDKKSITQANLAAQQAWGADAYLANAAEIIDRLFLTSYDIGDYKPADQWCREGRRRFPTNTAFVHCRLWLLGTKWAARPDPREAWANYDTLKAITPPAKWGWESSFGRILVAGALARAWNADQSNRALADSARHVLVAARVGRDVDPTLELSGYEAVVRVQLRDYDEAMDIIERYLVLNPQHRQGFATNTNQWWTDLQDKPRFKALIAGTSR